jgi:hypothetical protein
LKAQDHLMKYMGINLPVKNLILQEKFFHLFSGEVIDSYRWHFFPLWNPGVRIQNIPKSDLDDLVKRTFSFRLPDPVF